MTDVQTQTQTDRDSVLTSVKKMLGIAAEYTAFDTDIIIHINTVLSELQQLGVGLTDEQYEITSADDTWTMVLTTQKNLAMIRSYTYLRVRLMFDPPSSGYTTTSFQNQINELGWRIMTAASSTPNETPLTQ